MLHRCRLIEVVQLNDNWIIPSDDQFIESGRIKRDSRRMAISMLDVHLNGWAISSEAKVAEWGGALKLKIFVGYLKRGPPKNLGVHTSATHLTKKIDLLSLIYKVFYMKIDKLCATVPLNRRFGLCGRCDVRDRMLWRPMSAWWCTIRASERCPHHRLFLHPWVCPANLRFTNVFIDLLPFYVTI